MNKIVCIAAFLLGMLAIAWIGSTFVGTDPLALALSGVIACVYSIGVIELLHFRRATATLSSALATIATTPPQHNTDLARWLETLHPTLRNAVRLRIEGERVGLPAPVITPYLVGLLVMLGLLGTFAGMVDTLQGAVFALEGTTELQAIRAGLTAPIKGLSLAFGTSVAGIAASAMLGLISTLSRRDRMLATRTLDTQMAHSLRQFSRAYQQQDTFNALQTQTQALPEVAQKLHAVSDQLAHMSDVLSSQMLTNQQRFHDTTTRTYRELATSIEHSLNANLADSARQTGAALEPLISATMTGITAATEATHQQLLLASERWLETLSARFSNTAQDVAQAWQAGLSAHHHANTELVAQLQGALTAFDERFNNSTTTLLTSFDSLSSAQAERQAQDEQQQRAQWTQTLGQLQQQGVTQLLETAATFTDQLQQVASAQQDTLTTSAQQLASVAASLSAQWLATDTRQDEAEQRRLQQWTETLEQVQQQGVSQLFDAAKVFSGQLEQVAASQQSTLATSAQQLESVAASLSAQWLATDTRQDEAEQRRLQQWTETLEQIQQQGVSQLFDAAKVFSERLEQLATSQQSTLATSAQQLEAAAASMTGNWLEAGTRIDALTTTLATELSTLRHEEDARGQAALARLSALEATAATHIGSLGKTLEAPMARLIETASETPRAAAEVIGQLRQEIANTVARDNELLAERQRIMGELHTLSGTMQQACVAQREGIEHLVTSSSSVLQEVSTAFSVQIDSELAKVADASDRFSGSAVEITSLGDTFNVAVTLFNESNSRLIKQLGSIEESLRSSTERSDEQMHYYVTQAREIVDQTMLSQQQIVEELHALDKRSDALSAVAS